jgi:CRP-like cAMP-binding protein
MTHTFVTDIKENSYFGELGFITGEPRCLSAKSRDFTVCLLIEKDDFDTISENYIEAFTAMRSIKESLEKDNYKPLKV